MARAVGAQEPECTYEYMRIPSTAGTRQAKAQPLAK
jgi:hypothetical protein